MKKFPAKAICRAGAIAALYAVLTIYLGNIAYGPLQIRPAEALTLLPLLYLESVPALFVGCLIANLLSPYEAADIVVGSLLTLIAACLTYVMPRFFKKARLPRAGRRLVPRLSQRAGAARDVADNGRSGRLLDQPFVHELHAAFVGIRAGHAPLSGAGTPLLRQAFAPLSHQPLCAQRAGKRQGAGGS